MFSTIRIFSMIAVLMLFLGCTDTSMINNSSEQKTSWEKPKLEGDWKFVRAELVEHIPIEIRYVDPQPIVDEAPLIFPPYIGPDLHFEKDSIYYLDYPISITHRLRFTLDSGYLLTHSGNQVIQHHPIERKNDSLYIYKSFDQKRFIKESYVITTLDDSVMNILKTKGVNYPELAGTWKLIREDSFDDGSEYVLKFPFKIPDSISLTKAELIQVTKSNMVYWMTTGGKKRDYVLSYDRHFIYLTPSSWYIGKDPTIHFSKPSD